MKALDFLVNLKQSRDFDGNLESSLDEAIAELEETKTCEMCKYLLVKSRICTKQVQLHSGSLPENFYCNRYEPKGK